jgi:hypothetical protein
LLGGLCRSAIERYDFFIYLAAPLVFPTTFLSAGTGATAAVLALRTTGRTLSPGGSVLLATSLY